MFYACIAALAPFEGFSTTAIAQEDAEDSPYRPGLVASYVAGGSSISRLDEVVAFDWQDAAADERLPTGEVTATWRGRLWARGAGQYTLACYVQGAVTIKLAGKTIISGQAEQPGWLSSSPVELDFDHHGLEVVYRRTQPKGQLALFWSGPDFRLEPVPARALVHDREQSPSIEFERGRQLSDALRCGACHKNDASPGATAGLSITASGATAGLSSSALPPAPALDRLSGNIHESWLVDWLESRPPTPSEPESLAAPLSTSNVVNASRRMPHFGMTKLEAEAVAAWLLREPPTKSEPKKNEQKETKVTKEQTKKTETKSTKKSKGEEKPKLSAAEGEKLVLSRGCLACHKLGEFGESGLFGGGDLTAIFAKRPADFFVRWLQDPAAINRNHRMPVFTFTTDELTSLSLWAVEQAKVVGTLRVPSGEKKTANRDVIAEGQKLLHSFRCSACHSVFREGAVPDEPPRITALTASSNWSLSCAAQPDRSKNRPGYHLSAADHAALKTYYSISRPSQEKLSAQARGRDLLVQLNCLACHQREGVDRTASALPPMLQDKLVAVAESHGDLAPLVPAMTPPALNSVGDKLQDKALADAISRQGRPHRPYLLVQMPKFNLTKNQLADLTAYFIATDRIPSGAGLRPAIQNSAGETPAPQPRPPVAALTAAGPRLVTTDGLACTSCHQVGSVLPSKAPLNARGPDMSMLGQRIRREWFDRWCDNPARIVPRMEMPAVKVPVRGVLNDNVVHQLDAVWHILNTPGFEPPEPNPVRVLRLSGIPEKNERPIVIHDVVKDGDKTYLYPLVIGLPNRHNILFDLETNRLAAWWLGDTARQRTKGKSWYWEMGGKSLVPPAENSELSLIVDGKEVMPTASGQFLAELGGTNSHLSNYKAWAGFGSYLTFSIPSESDSRRVFVGQTFQSLDPKSLGRGFVLSSIASSALHGQVQLKIVNSDSAKNGHWDKETRTYRDRSIGTWIRIDYPDTANWMPDGSIRVPFEGEPTRQSAVSVNLTYGTDLPSDQFAANESAAATIADGPISIAPGLTANRLPLPVGIMPSGLTWKNSGELAFSTLKGEVFLASDSNGDELEDRAVVLADGLPTPYGLDAVSDEAETIHVATKSGLIGIHSSGPSEGSTIGGTTTCRFAASGWGHTDDYHDWTVGPIRGDNSEYYVALPCQQDQRTTPAAAYRGRLVKLVPKREPNRRINFDIEIISAGHRFPMGMARNREGELFVTDNQGNYNPFNELNHVRKGAHFGFINALEKQNGFQPPPLTPPAINIPHPWTRSVNGICFLETPVGWVKDAERSQTHAGKSGGSAVAATSTHPTNIFGPFEGHLVGCEYDTRRLIRMSLQKIGDTYQGCCYPLSIPPEDVEKGLLGPIVCAIKPTTGELYVGEIRDSGWGASNNIGQITKIKIEPENLPCGIAEVRATKTGFTIDFIQPVDPAKARDLASYSIQSYRRESTPAYGGPDIDRRDEKISKVELSTDAKRATITLPELRAGGHVYEIRVKNLAPGGAMFHPDEAHYTLNWIPE